MPHLLVSCLVAAFIISLYTLWTRRQTLTMEFERGISIALALFLVGLVLTQGLMRNPCGHHMAGNLAETLGCLAFISGTALVTHSTVEMVLAPIFLNDYVIRMIRLPAIGGAVVITACFLLADTGMNVARLYWVAVGMTVAYLTCVEMCALRVLRRERRHRVTANLYLVAAVAVFLACIDRMLVVQPCRILLGLCAISLTFFAAGSGWSWARKQNSLSMRPVQRERETDAV